MSFMLNFANKPIMLSFVMLNVKAHFEPGPQLTRMTILEWLARDKHSSFLRTFVNYGRIFFEHWALDMLPNR
jgi:hypothetical protein